MRFVASAVLIVSLLTAPSASASLVGETTETVRSTVKSVQDVLKDPPVPNAAPPAPATPPTPAVPPVPVSGPTDQPQAHSPTSSGPAGSGSHAPSASGVTAAAENVARNAVDSVTGAGAEAARRAPRTPAPAGDDDGVRVPDVGQLPGGGQVSSSRREDESGATGAAPEPTGTASSATDASARRARHASDIASSTSLAVAAGQVVDLQRWLTHIWPGIPLIGEAAGGSAVGAIEAGLLSSVAATADRLLLAVTSAATTVGDSTLGTHPPAANGRYTDLLGVMSTDDWRKILYWVVLAVLLALLAFVVWRDFRPALGPGAR